MTQDKKVALVTGANKGIGLEIARQLGKQNIAVVLGSRDAAKGQNAAEELKAEGIDAHTVQLEVTNVEDVAALPDFFEQNFGRLDILVNNAAIQNDNAPGGVTPDSLREIYEANVIGPFAVTQTLLPLLKASPAGRIVNHSSILGSLATVSGGVGDWATAGYTSSKAALNMLTIVQSQNLKDTSIKVNAAHPGSVKTDMNPHGDLTVVEGAQTAVRLATLPGDGPTGGFFHGDQSLPW